MLTCRDVATLLSQDVDGELSTLDRATLQAHLAICDTCTQIARQFKFLKSAVAQKKDVEDSDVPVTLSDDSKTRLKDALTRAIDDSKNE